LNPARDRPAAILFDWDNTLIDGWAAIAAALNAVFARHGMPRWTASEARANVRGSLRDTFPAMFGPLWQKDATLFYDTLAVLHLDHLRALPGAAALLRACAGLPCAVVSNKAGRFLRAEVAHLGWNDFFGAVIGAGDAAADKPDAAPLLLALNQLALSSGPRIWYIGDTALDMQAARNAGCRAVLLGDASHDGGREKAGADAIYHDANHLMVEIAALAS
jgi:phosphoglycolate phosphatase